MSYYASSVRNTKKNNAGGGSYASSMSVRTGEGRHKMKKTVSKKNKIPSPPRYAVPTSKSLRRNLRFTTVSKRKNEKYMRKLRERDDQENYGMKKNISSKTTSSFTSERAQLQTVISKLRKENRELEEKLTQMDAKLAQMDRESKSKASLERVEAIESDLTKTRNRLKTCMRRSREDRDAWQLALETMKTENRTLVLKLNAARSDSDSKTELIATLEEKLAKLEAEMRRRVVIEQEEERQQQQQEQQQQPLSPAVEASPIRSVVEEEDLKEEPQPSQELTPKQTPRRDFTSGVYDLLKAFEEEDESNNGTIDTKRFVQILKTRARTVPAFKIMVEPQELNVLLQMFGPDRGILDQSIDYPAFVDFVMGSYTSPARSSSSSSPISSSSHSIKSSSTTKKSKKKNVISSVAETVRRRRLTTTTTPSSAPASSRRREQIKITSALWRRRRVKFDDGVTTKKDRI